MTQPTIDEVNEANALITQKRYGYAEVFAKALIRRYPGQQLGWRLLALTYRLTAQNQKALEPLRKLTDLNPDDPKAHSELGAALIDLGMLDDALASCARALTIQPDHAPAHANIALILNARGKTEDSLAHFHAAVEADPTLLVAQHGLNHALNKLVPGWHVPMMNEESRNDFYQASLKLAITAQSQVLEIGTGSGLLAMMAAALGADHVTSCESVPLIADKAKEIVGDNGLSDRITVVPKHSTGLQVGTDLPRKADILVSEIFSSELLGEHVLPSIEDAKRRLLKPGGKVVPAVGSIMIALVGGEDVRRHTRVDNSHGFNLSRFNSIVKRKWLLPRQDFAAELLSEGVEALRFDFQSIDEFPAQSTKLNLRALSSGPCYGVIQWIRLETDQDARFENHPLQATQPSNWQHGLYLFPEPLNLNEGDSVCVAACHDRKIPWFFLDAVESGASVKGVAPH